MSVRAKFKVSEVAKTEYGTRIMLRPVTSGSDENRAFFVASPAGQMEMLTVNPEAAKQFEVGTEMYVDFTVATPATT